MVNGNRNPGPILSCGRREFVRGVRRQAGRQAQRKEKREREKKDCKEGFNLLNGMSDGVFMSFIGK